MSRESALRGAYASCFAAYLDGDEAALHDAYDLGRDAVSSEVSLLEIVDIHHDSLANALSPEMSGAERYRIARVAGEVLLETLSPYEMVARGFVDARDATLFERRRTVMLRQLSTLLSDASLAADAAGQYEEVLRLAADHARELTNARWCLVAIHGGTDIWSADDGDDSLDGRAHLLTLLEKAALQSEARTLRFSAPEPSEAATRAPAMAADGDEPRYGSIGAPLTALDKTQFGWIQLANRASGEFTAADEALLLHVAQLTAAALERASIYEQGRPPRIKRHRSGRG